MSLPLTYIALPLQAAEPLDNDGLFYSMNIGLATGVYSKAMWSDAQGLVKANIPRHFLDPEWRLCQTWNQACWFAMKGVKLEPSAFTYEVMRRPVRKVQPPEILSLAYPPGSTIVIESDDELLPYAHRNPLPITVSVVRRGPDETFIPLVTSPEHSQTSSSVRATLSSRGAVSAVRSVPSAELGSNPFLEGFMDTSSSQKGKATYVSPEPTLVASGPSTPATEFEIDDGAFDSPIYVHRSTHITSLRHDNTGAQSLEHGGNSAGDIKLSDSQQSVDSSQYDIIASEGRRRLSALRNMRHVDQDVEARINAYVVLNMLAAMHLPDESIDEIKAAAAALRGPLRFWASRRAVMAGVPWASEAGSEPLGTHHGTQPSGDIQVVNTVADGPVSKRRAKRILERHLASKAVEIDQQMRTSIEEAAANLGVAPKVVAQKFAIVAPIGETRKPMWWNGLVSEKAEEWEKEYDGPKRGFLPWVSSRISDEKLGQNLSSEDQERLAKKAGAKRALNKEQKAATMTRAKSIKAAEDQIESIYGELQLLHTQLGLEFALFTTRGSIEDDMNPVYLSSNKAKVFLQGQLNLPPKQLLKLMDMSVVAGVGEMSTTVANEKEVYRQRVRRKLNASYCSVLESLGHNTSDFKHIKYKHYDDLVRKYRIILRGYPLTSNGCIVSPSDFPGGMTGLAHAEKQLESGAWGFEAIQESEYDDWEAECNTAKEKDDPVPSPPHIPVPGTEYVKQQKKTTGRVENTSKLTNSRKRATEDGENTKTKKLRPAQKVKKPVNGRPAAKSRAMIEESDSEEEDRDNE